MVTVTCPWCAEDLPVELARIKEPETTFTCADCGTTVALVDEPGMTLDVAA